MSDHELRSEEDFEVDDTHTPTVSVPDLMELWALGNLLHEWAQDPNSMSEERLAQVHYASAKFGLNSTTALFQFQKEWRRANITPEREVTGIIERIEQIRPGLVHVKPADHLLNLSAHGGSKYGITDYGQEYAQRARAGSAQREISDPAEVASSILQAVQNSLQVLAEPPNEEPKSREDIEHQIDVLEDLAENSELGLDAEAQAFLEALRIRFKQIEENSEALERAKAFKEAGTDKMPAPPTSERVELITHDPNYNPEDVASSSAGRIAIPEDVLAEATNGKAKK